MTDTHWTRAQRPLGWSVLMLSLLAATGALAQEPSHCLPPEAGQVVSGLVQQGRLAEALPEGWRLASANIDRSTLTIALTDDAGHTHAVVLGPPAEKPGPGSWFASDLRLADGPDARLAERTLLAVAKRIDAGFADSPWIGCGTPGSFTDEAPTEFPWAWLAAGLVALTFGLGLASPRLALGVLGLTGRAQDWLGRYGWLVLALLLIPWIAARLIFIEQPFDGDYATQRLFFGSLDLGDILAHRYADQRHPQLFYVVLHGFLWLGHAEWVVRLPAVLFSVTTAVALFALARRQVGAARALAAVALVGLSTPFLVHSVDVSDVTLFLSLALLSSLLLLRTLDDPSWRMAVLLGLAEVAMLYAYYMAILVALAHVVCVLLFARSSPARRVLWLTIAGAALLALPALLEFAEVFFADQSTRQVAGTFPEHVWGHRAPGEFLTELLGLLVPQRPWAWLAGLLVLAGVYRFGRQAWRQPLGVCLLVLIVLAGLVVLGGVFLVRLKPYYLIIMLPVAALLMAVGGLGNGREDFHGASSWGRTAIGGRLAAGLALIIVCAGAALQQVNWIQREAKGEGHRLYVSMAAEVQGAGGADVVVGDPNSLHTILVYYLFPEPLRMYRTCHQKFRQANRCALGDRRLITLTSLPHMQVSWEQESIRRLEALGLESFWFVYTERFENQPLLTWLAERCRARGRWDHLRLFRCEPRPGGSLESGVGEGAVGLEVEEGGRLPVVLPEHDRPAVQGPAPPGPEAQGP